MSDATVFAFTLGWACTTIVLNVIIGIRARRNRLHRCFWCGFSLGSQLWLPVAQVRVHAECYLRASECAQRFFADKSGVHVDATKYGVDQ